METRELYNLVMHLAKKKKDKLLRVSSVHPYYKRELDLLNERIVAAEKEHTQDYSQEGRG